MNLKKANLFAGVAAIISGLLFAVIQFIHPVNELSSLTSAEWLIAHVLTFLFPVFGILGLTGIYLNQISRSGYLGLIGYLMLSGAFVLMICFAFYEAFIAPVLVKEAPLYVANALSVLDGEAGPQYIGVIYQINGVLYLLGGLLFGIATSKAGVFSRWASGLVVAGVLVTLSAAAVPAMARPSAVIFGVGIASLGYLLATGRYSRSSQ